MKFSFYQNSQTNNVMIFNCLQIKDTNRNSQIHIISNISFLLNNLFRIDFGLNTLECSKYKKGAHDELQQIT